MGGLLGVYMEHLWKFLLVGAAIAGAIAVYYSIAEASVPREHVYYDDESNSIFIIEWKLGHNNYTYLGEL